MREVVQRFLTRRMARVALPELVDDLPRLSAAFDRVLAAIPQADLLAKKYEIDVKDLDEPDDGIFLKRPERKDDPSAIRDGVPGDHKVNFQTRLRAPDLLRSKGLYIREFDEYFAMHHRVRAKIDPVIENFLDELHDQRPDLGRMRHNRDMTVVRCTNYLGARSDGSGLAGKRHNDQCDFTWHLYDNREGLQVEHLDGQIETVPSVTGQGFVFLSRRLAPKLDLPPVEHGAKHVEGRKIVVCFVHLHHS